MARNAVDMTFDIREFERAMIEYAAATGKTMAEVANRAAKNWGFRSASKTKKGDRAKIKKLPGQEFW
ncbi:unnamed protein product, partial [marine sediment metagenome]